MLIFQPVFWELFHAFIRFSANKSHLTILDLAHLIHYIRRNTTPGMPLFTPGTTKLNKQKQINLSIVRA